MPVGMGEGWPTKQTGTELSVIVDNDLYALDPSSSLESARIKVYDHVEDSWKVVEGDVLIRVAEIEIMIAEPKRKQNIKEQEFCLGFNGSETTTVGGGGYWWRSIDDDTLHLEDEYKLLEKAKGKKRIEGGPARRI